MRTLAARRNYQTAPQVCEGACAPSGRRSRNRRSPGCLFERLLCPRISASPWFTASCCSDGSLAVFQPLWLQKSSEVSSLPERVATAPAGAYPTSNAGTSLGRHCVTAHTSQTSPYGSVHPHLAGDVHLSVRASALKKKGFCPTACATCPMLVDRDCSFRSWSVYQNRNPRWVSLHGSALMGQQALAGTQSRKPRDRKCGISTTLQQQTYSPATAPLGLSGMTLHQTRPCGASIDRVRVFRTLQAGQRRGQWKAFSSVTKHDKSCRRTRVLPRGASEDRSRSSHCGVFSTRVLAV